jgi:hypothetical protein
VKPKPDVASFAGLAKDPNDFLDGATADTTPGETNQPTPKTGHGTGDMRRMTISVAKPEPTVAKMFRLRWDVAAALKFGAAEESVSAGRRVTETEIVERLLRKYFKISG